ncbi:sugar ABC transporter ATP-binding protein [Acidisoma cellulosilytica]|uniref:Sugar ABC transporter ATP-binding protein n=1 Tax=Acidisoma cellulosilyticum TaxID=2802395 RepID=A0A963Z4E7_9PROT|nr:sugar ABC transporter ATP-binding protein [Acidisoma cellulosilyticum]MCB8882619.1 sugar ABC transporter ATP-binding protein [Acidisoma cellulosilyticum]
MDRGIIDLSEVTKSFGAVHALRGVDLTIRSGEALGLVGHNGAGKSTLMHILTGTVAPTAGIISADQNQRPDYDVNIAKMLGIRCVFQELSLCPNLTVAENTCITHRPLSGLGWRKRAGKLIIGKLDEIFPGHGIMPGAIVSDLSIGRRQMVEIARAFTKTDIIPRLIILDEPTSSLDPSTSQQLLSFMRRFVSEGGATIFISHLLQEILDYCDRIVVMRDGRVVADDIATEFGRSKLITTMGGAAGGHQVSSPESARSASSTGNLRVRYRAKTQPTGIELSVHAGEIVGLAGLAGHGQSLSLIEIFEAAGGRPGRIEVNGQVALVAGDRQTDGIFPLWSIADNITVRSLTALTRGALISQQRAGELAKSWKERIGIRTPDLDNNILSLSGGNQQKALFARAFGSNAETILMDDPMRGVDIGTKLDVYRLIEHEAEQGRCFLWYTTEMDELAYCHKIYIFRNRQIVAQLSQDELTEERVIHSSFQEAV